MSELTSFMFNSTIAPDPGLSLPYYTGFLFLLGSSILYGSNYLPVKQYETGDGMYFQLILCTAIWTVGFLVFLSRNLPTFYALPMLGGFLWATGNVNTVIIIRTIGLGLGMLFWNVVGLITGWGTARFGWFGVKKQVPSDVTLNYVGVALALLSTFFYLFVKPDARIKTESESDNSLPQANISEDSANSIVRRSTVNLIDEDQSQVTNTVQINQPDFLDRLNPNVKRIIGILLAVISGVLYGESNTPVLIARDQHDKEGNYLDYLFSFYTGILASSIGYFIIYSTINKFKPKIYPRVTLAAFVSGWMWGGANLCYFMATNALTQSISYPISASGPPIVASLWSIFLYKEIKGLRNFSFLIAGFISAIIGSILVGISF